MVLGDLTADEARDARARYGIPEGAVTDADAAHPLTLRLLADVRSDVAATAPDGPVDRDDVLAAHLDLTCLRIAQRLAGDSAPAAPPYAVWPSGPPGRRTRRPAAASGRRTGRWTGRRSRSCSRVRTRVRGGQHRRHGPGWADAVLAEGLLVPAGDGYRFGHEELADWLQGAHLDLDGALHTLVHTPAADTAPVPRHRIGPVAEALLCLARRHGPPGSPPVSRTSRTPWTPTPAPGGRPACSPASSSACPTPARTRTCCGCSPTVSWPGASSGGPSARAGSRVLDAAAAARGGALRPAAPPGPGRRTSVRERSPLPRRRRRTAHRRPRDRPAVPRPLVRRRAAAAGHPHATVATAAQALLHTHRRAAPDALTEALVDSPHRRADELLAVLAEEEPGVLCRAVDRWAEDPAQPAVPQPSPMACGSRRTPATSATAPCCGTPPSPSWCAPPTAPCTAAPSPSSSVTRTAGDATSPAPSNGSRPATRTSRRARSPTPSPPTPNPSSKRSVPGSPRARTRRTPSAPSPTPPRPPWPARSPPSSGRRPPGGPS
ncbi:hypothetical protein ACFQV4_31270 [Streptomyces thermocarboxydus]